MKPKILLNADHSIPNIQQQISDLRGGAGSF